MANERRFLWAMTLVLSVGLAIMLYGVLLTAGQSVNTPMIVGGVVVLLPFALLVYWTASIREPAGGSHS